MPEIDWKADHFQRGPVRYSGSPRGVSVVIGGRASGFDVLWLHGRVRRVADASIMPRIARADTIAPCVSAGV
ncbi:hypothetical protein [Mycobacterium intracellulare]|uniref:hypothetical protein n=1 Tax=Mycobacterium intracellulare TaxID=1767 RepID=UPI000B08B3D2|nr:hypothetical protein [Mycobacterium intracellulare]